MKINLPVWELYTPKELAEHWSTTVQQINQQVRAGKLRRCGRLAGGIGGDLQYLPYEFREPLFELFYKREDVERFEREHDSEAWTPKGPIKQPPETDKELVDRLKLVGHTDKAIAQELKRAFPNILPSKIGRLLPAHPGANVGPSAPRKRGERLLK